MKTYRMAYRHIDREWVHYRFEPENRPCPRKYTDAFCSHYDTLAHVQLFENEKLILDRKFHPLLEE